MSGRRQAKRTNQAAVLDANPRQRKVLFMHAFLAGFTALQILYLALDDLKLNLILSAGFALGYAYAYALPARWRVATEYAVSGLSAIVSVVYFLRYLEDNSMYGNLLGIVGGILMVLLSFRAFTTNAHRFILMFCVVFLLFGAVASYDLKFMLLLPLFLIFSGCALYIGNQIDVHAVAAEQQEQLPSGAGLTRPFVSVLLRSVFVILGLSVLAYIAAPHSASLPRSLVMNRSAVLEETTDEPVPVDPQTPDQRNSRIGLGEDFDLTEEGELEDSPQQVLRVKSHRSAYLRAQVYDAFTGSGWVKSPRLPGEISASGSGELISLKSISDYYVETRSGYSVPLIDFPSMKTFSELKAKLQVEITGQNAFSRDHGQDVPYSINQQQVTLLADQPPFYFGSYQVFRLQNVSRTPQGRAFDQPQLDLAATLRPDDLTKVHPKGFGYTALSLEPSVSTKRLDEVYEAGPEDILSNYLWLPLEGSDWQNEAQLREMDPAEVRPVSRRLQNFSKRFSSPADVDGHKIYPSVWDKVQGISDWLVKSGEFTYDRSYPPTPPGVEVTEAFCFNTKAGYCRHFASAMAVLCRLNGVAARVVTGYSPGFYSLADNAYIYRASNAHAWVEVYFDGFGWITFDPTPGSPSTYSNPSSTQWMSEVVDFLQELFVIDPAGTQQTILESLIRVWNWIVVNLRLISLVAGSLAVLALVAILAVRRVRRRRAAAPFAPENYVVGEYLKLRSLLVRLGFVLETGDTAREIFQSAGHLFPMLEPALEAFLPVYERAAYSSRQLAEEELRLAEESYNAVASAVQQELDARKKARRD